MRPRTSSTGSCVMNCCTARLQPKNTPLAFTAITRSQSSSEVSSKRRAGSTDGGIVHHDVEAAEFLDRCADQRIHLRPDRHVTGAKARDAAGRPRSPPASARRLRATVSVTSPITTFAPSRANSVAMARPIPDAPPVTMTTLPLSRMRISPPFASPQHARPLDASRAQDRSCLQICRSPPCA